MQAALVVVQRAQDGGAGAAGRTFVHAVLLAAIKARARRGCLYTRAPFARMSGSPAALLTATMFGDLGLKLVQEARAAEQSDTIKPYK